jgi:hypothetical protein
MIHEIMGFEYNTDTPVYEVVLPLKRLELQKIMGWKYDDDCAADYELTPEQIKAIEVAGNMELPKGLDLFLTTSGEWEG